MEFGLLGPLEVTRGTAVVPVEGQRQRRLLAILLLNQKAVVPVEQLIGHLWEDPPASARQQVHNAVARLRRSLAVSGEADAVATTEVGYRIRASDEQVDVNRFAAGMREAERAAIQGRPEEAVRLLRSALAHWRGPALAGLDGQLLASAGARLNEQRLVAIERLLTLRSELGEQDTVIGDLTELLAMHPLRDSLRTLLMLTYYRAGRRQDALEVYETGRRQLASELGLDPSPELRALHVRVLRADSSLLPTRPGVTARERPAIPTKSLLPRVPTVFLGRTQESDLIMAEARRASTTGPAIVSIDGMGGIGKTSLALWAAHRLAHVYPDGQLFVDLHGFSRDRDPVTSTAALNLLLRTAGFPPEQIHPDTEGRAAQWRSHIAGRRVLVMLDNASCEAQVRQLIPGTSEAFVLITSRQRLVGIEGMVPISLDVLSVEDAVTLLHRISGSPTPRDSLAEAVVKSCGLLPLAVRIVASRLRHHPAWSIEHLAQLLGDEQRLGQLLTTGDRDVFGELVLSYQRLADEQRRLFRLLAILPRCGFDRHAVAAIANVSLVDAEQRLDELVEANLVVHWQVRHYRVPGLLYDLAWNLLRRHRVDDDPDSGASSRLMSLFRSHSQATILYLRARTPSDWPLSAEGY